MGQGMSRYAKLHAESGGKFSVDTLASFDLYCHYVAGLVGEGLQRLQLQGKDGGSGGSGDSTHRRQTSAGSTL